MKFRKKPLVIDAVQLTWENWSQVCELVDSADTQKWGRPWGFRPDGEQDQIAMKIPTAEGLMQAQHLDWIIKGVAGELYACKPDIFEKTHAPVQQSGLWLPYEAQLRTDTSTRKQIGIAVALLLGATMFLCLVAFQVCQTLVAESRIP